MSCAPRLHRAFSSLRTLDRKSTRLNSSHANISYAVFCLKKKKNTITLHLTPMSSALFFFFNDTATTEIYTLSLHDALPIYGAEDHVLDALLEVRLTACGHLDRPLAEQVEEHRDVVCAEAPQGVLVAAHLRSEEHTSELQSRQYLVCRLLLEKKKKYNNTTSHAHELCSFFFF